MTTPDLAELWRLLDVANSERVMTASLEMDYSLMRKSTRALFVAAVNAIPALLDAAAERDALAAKVERVRALADLIDRHTEYERDPVDFRDASHGGSWDDVADRIRRAIDEEPKP